MIPGKLDVFIIYVIVSQLKYHLYNRQAWCLKFRARVLVWVNLFQFSFNEDCSLLIQALKNNIMVNCAKKAAKKNWKLVKNFPRIILLTIKSVALRDFLTTSCDAQVTHLYLYHWFSWCINISSQPMKKS